MYANRLAAVALGLAAAGATTLPANATPVDALSCHQLWVARNQIYKFDGYCFQTAKARNYFGNAGCTIHDMNDVPLSKGELDRVLTYKHWETVNGC